MAKKKEASVTQRKILPAKSDVIFKMLFGDVRNKDILIDFLKAILKLPEDEYENITITDPHLKRERKNDKLGIVDIKLESKSGKIIHIEIQVLEQEEMPERTTYYNAKMLTAQLKSGQEFDTLKKTITILITDYEIISDKQKHHYTFELLDKETGVRFTELIEIHTLELQKTPKKSDNTAEYDWLKFLKAESEEELDMIAETRPAIGKAVAELKILSQSEQAHMIYENRQKAIRDENSRLKSARKKGKEEGRAEGRVEGKAEGRVENAIEIAINLLDVLDVETIAQKTKLTVEKVEELKAKHSK